MFQITILELNEQSKTNLFGKFLLKPLPFGHGITIGNTLRRVLLNDIYGSAITGVEILGLKSEFSTIPGVREDVFEILLNLKQVILQSDRKKVCYAHLKILGPKIITAGCIDFPAGVQNLNPELYIATIYSEIYLEMTFRIEYGQGYQLSDQINSDASSNFINLDGLFMPVQKVNYFVNEFYTSKTNEFNANESLEIDIWTNGTVTPQMVLQQAVKYSINLFSMLLTYPQLKELDSVKYDVLKHFKGVPIEKLALSARVYKCLKATNIHFLSDLFSYSITDLCELKNFGQKCRNEVKYKLQNYFKTTMEEFYSL